MTKKSAKNVRFGKTIAAVLSVLAFVLCSATIVSAQTYAKSPSMAVPAQQLSAGLKRLPTDVGTPSEGCSFVGLEGEYICQTQEALDLINSYRKEACEEGVINPSTGKPLTMADYVPIKWSSDLEYIARIRAAESSITVGHERLTEKSIWMTAPSGEQSWSEDLAWNWTNNMLSGIGQWYSEKNDWINKTPGAVVGHYTSMIDPEYTYVGVATFLTSDARWPNTTAAEFSFKSSMDETRGTATGKIVQTLEIDNRCIDGIGIYEDNGQLHMNAVIKYDGYTFRNLELIDTANGKLTWSSSSSDIDVDKNGKLTVKKCSSTTITGTLELVNSNGTTFSKSSTYDIETVHEFGSETVTKQPTCTQSGIKSIKCAKCGDVREEEIPATGHSFGAWTANDDATHKRTCQADGAIETEPHSWNDGTITKQPTCTENGVRTYTCADCGETKTENIDALGHDIKPDVTVKEPTCKETGIKASVCSRCGAQSDEVTLPVTTHKGGQATCTKKAVCDSCGQTYGSIDVEHHGNTVVKNAVAATASTVGYSGDICCEDCGVVLTKGTVIPAGAVVTQVKPPITTGPIVITTPSVTTNAITAPNVTTPVVTSTDPNTPVTAAPIVTSPVTKPNVPTTSGTGVPVGTVKEPSTTTKPSIPDQSGIVPGIGTGMQSTAPDIGSDLPITTDISDYMISKRPTLADCTSLIVACAVLAVAIAAVVIVVTIKRRKTAANDENEAKAEEKEKNDKE